MNVQKKHIPDNWVAVDVYKAARIAAAKILIDADNDPDIDLEPSGIATTPEWQFCIAFTLTIMGEHTESDCAEYCRKAGVAFVDVEFNEDDGDGEGDDDDYEIHTTFLKFALLIK